MEGGRGESSEVVQVVIRELLEIDYCASPQVLTIQIP